MAPESVVEEIIEGDGAAMGEEAETASEEKAVEPETAAEESKPESEKPKPTTTQPAVSLPKGIVDTVREYVMGNLMIIGGALGGLILLIVAFLFLRSWRSSAVTGGALAVPDEEIPDIDIGSEDETELPEGGSEDETDIKVSDEGTAEDSENEEEATIFIDQSEEADAQPLEATADAASAKRQ